MHTVTDDLGEGMPTAPAEEGPILGLFTGERTIGDSAVPPILFATFNTWLGMTPGIIAALGAGLALTVIRLRRGGTLVYALGGIGAVGIAVVFALQSGRAEGYFLPGILSNAGYAVATAVSILVRRPATALVSSFIYRRPLEWYWRDDVRPAYSTVAWFWTIYWAVRSGAQAVLFAQGRAELLAAVRVISGVPIGIPLLIASTTFIKWRLGTLGGPNVDEHIAGA